MENPAGHGPAIPATQYGELDLDPSAMGIFIFASACQRRGYSLWYDAYLVSVHKTEALNRFILSETH